VPLSLKKWIVSILVPFGIVPSSICKALGIKDTSGKIESSGASSGCTNYNLKMNGRAHTNEEDTFLDGMMNRHGFGVKALSEGEITEIEAMEVWEEILQKDKVIVVKFTASWCKPCKAIHPYYKDMAARYEDMMFVEVDVDEIDDLAQKYDVQVMPTFIVAKNKIEVGRTTGKNEEKLERLVSQHSF